MRRLVRSLSIGFMVILMMVSISAVRSSPASAAPAAIPAAVQAQSQPTAVAHTGAMLAVSDSYCRARRWGYGSTGPCVTRIQHLFNYVKSDYALCGMSRTYGDLAEDGGYGDKTYTAIRYLQGKCGFKVDGIVGPQTWSALIPFG